MNFGLFFSVTSPPSVVNAVSCFADDTVREWARKVRTDLIHYTCMHCGKVANLPDDKRETVFTCPACQFSNWVSGMAIAEPEPPSPRFRQEAPPPPPRPPGGQSQA